MLNTKFNRSFFLGLLKQKPKSLEKLQELIESLLIFINAFKFLKPTTLKKNGFNDSFEISAFLNWADKKLQQLYAEKSLQLQKSQLPGQIALFGLGFVDNYAEVRKRGYFTYEGNRYNRQAPIVYIKGKNTTASFALNIGLDCHFAVIESAFLQPSHMGNVQNPLHFIPEAQPRNRAASKSGADTPRLIAENLRPLELIGGVSAYSGAPIVNERGEVIQGNGRAYAIKYYWSAYETDPKGYKQALMNEAACFGFKAKEIEEFKNPVLVRMAQVPDAIAITFGQYTQKDLEAVANKVTQTKSKVNLITPKVVEQLVTDLLQHDTPNSEEQPTLNQLIRKGQSLKILVRENIIRADDLENYTKNNVINDEGSRFVESILLGVIWKQNKVETPDIFAMLPDTLQKAIGKAALFILKIDEKRSLSKDLGEAIEGYRQMLLSNVFFNQWKNEVNLFTGQPNKAVYSPYAIALIQTFEELKNKQKALIDKFKMYARLATPTEENMFEPATPGLPKNEAFNQAFGVKVTAEPTQNSNLQLAKAKAAALLLLQKQN